MSAGSVSPLPPRLTLASRPARAAVTTDKIYMEGEATGGPGSPKGLSPKGSARLGSPTAGRALTSGGPPRRSGGEPYDVSEGDN